MPDPGRLSAIIHLLQRLERISADSRWAHLASGYRGSLLKVLDQVEKGELPEPARLDALIAGGTTILTHAAREKLSNRPIRQK